MIHHNEKLYARVSDVLRPFTNFGHIDKDVLAAKADLGTKVHHYIQNNIEGVSFEIGRPEAVGYFKSFEKWREAVDPRFVESSIRYYCDEKMLTGELDALIKIEGEEKAVLVDWKTSVTEADTWIMQGHLYHYLLKRNDRDVADRFLFIKLDKYGGLPKVFDYKLDANLLQRCLQAVDDYWTEYNIARNLLEN